jgi:hypothetical protein
MPQLTGNRSQRHLTWMPMSIQMMTQMMMTMSQTSRVIICLVLHLVLSLRLAHTPHERQRPRPSLILLLAACRVVDVGDGETVSLATSDVLGLADVPVTLPDRLWAECSESRGSTRSTILGPLLRDSNTYAVLADGFVYLFPAADLIRFLPAIRLQHKPSANGSRQPLVLRGEGAQREVPMFC